MRIGAAFLTACAVTLIMTLGIAWLPEALLNNEKDKGGVPVFHGTPVVHLTNANIVDALLRVQLHERLGHVEWKSSVLQLDLLVPSDGGRPAAWFDDVEQLVRVSFLQFDNVNRLLIRIVEDEEEKKRLLAAVDVRANDAWLNDSSDSITFSDPVHDETWRKRLRLSFTTAWIDRFGLPTGYSAQSKKERTTEVAN